MNEGIAPLVPLPHRLRPRRPRRPPQVCAELAAHGLLGTPERPEPRPLAYEDLSRLRYLGMVLKVGGGWFFV